MKRFIIFTAILFLPTFVFAQEYQSVSHTGYGEAVDILHNGKVIYSILPKYQKEILKEDWMGKTTLVHPIYDRYLIDRASISQSKAFDDITGDGIPNFVCLERIEWFSNGPSHPAAVRVFSVSGDKVEEFEPILADLGEIIYFDDFNKDGAFELVATDQERSFSYDKDGLPISKYVWILDKEKSKYYQKIE